MSLLSSITISASGLTAERLRMDVIANNIANANTTRTSTGGPYRRQEVVFAAAGPLSFPKILGAAQRLGFVFGSRALSSRIYDGIYGEYPGTREYSGLAGAGRRGSYAPGGVVVLGIVEDPSPPRMVYDPGHPDADQDGYVAMPNVEIVKEMVDMISASRAYEANVTAINAAKSMALKALEIGRG